MMGALKNLWQDDSGISSVEYALLAALVAVAIIAGAKILGKAVNNKLNNVANNINSGS